MEKAERDCSSGAGRCRNAAAPKLQQKMHAGCYASYSTVEKVKILYLNIDLDKYDLVLIIHSACDTFFSRISSFNLTFCRRFFSN